MAESEAKIVRTDDLEERIRISFWAKNHAFDDIDLNEINPESAAIYAAKYSFYEKVYFRNSELFIRRTGPNPVYASPWLPSVNYNLSEAANGNYLPTKKYIHMEWTEALREAVKSNRLMPNLHLAKMAKIEEVMRTHYIDFEEPPLPYEDKNILQKYEADASLNV